MVDTVEQHMFYISVSSESRGGMIDKSRAPRYREIYTGPFLRGELMV